MKGRVFWEKRLLEPKQEDPESSGSLYFLSPSHREGAEIIIHAHDLI